MGYKGFSGERNFAPPFPAGTAAERVEAQREAAELPLAWTGSIMGRAYRSFCFFAINCRRL
jgi:hypothetical protein